MVLIDGSVIPDLARRLPGRGAHLHHDQGCLDLAERRRAFQRAFRLSGRPLDSTAVREALTHQAPPHVSTASPSPVQSEAGREAR